MSTQGTHGTGKTGKWPKKIPVRENTGNLEILPKHRENTGNFVCSSCKFPDAKGKGYFDICCKNFGFFPEAGLVCFVYVKATNYGNWHREKLWLDRENTGNLKIQFEWVPCHYVTANNPSESRSMGKVKGEENGFKEKLLLC